MENLTGGDKVFNTPLEIGFRTLAILNSSMPSPLDVERLMYFDYLNLNTGDLGGEESLHAPVPNRGVQVYARKELIQKGLAVLLSKELINVDVSPAGFFYSINENGTKFIQYFDSDYFKLLISRINWVILNFGGKSNIELRDFIRERLQDWGGEFIIGKQN